MASEEKNCRVAWRAPTGKTGHGTASMSHDTCNRIVKDMNDSERKRPEGERIMHWVEYLR